MVEEGGVQLHSRHYGAGPGEVELLQERVPHLFLHSGPPGAVGGVGGGGGGGGGEYLMFGAEVEDEALLSTTVPEPVRLRGVGSTTMYVAVCVCVVCVCVYVF